ncbi:CBS domain-containing protein [Cephalotus follicularis]|uniref:CBS domain-containing protein n=1 Tax=Cephalotus follicularis TaxID=3775 RepID=A0A1Q3DGW2_CEPFO|nr:CBS domain-containing protein [Cephalotus follicularis]
MNSILHSDALCLTRLRANTNSATSASQLPCLFLLLSRPCRRQFSMTATASDRISQLHNRSFVVAAGGTLTTNSVPPRNGVYTVGDFMTTKDHLHVVKPTTTVDEALELLVDNRITGFPVIDDDWKLVGLVSDYDLLALDSIIGGGRTDNSMFPEVDSTWKTFNEVQNLLSKTNGKVVGDLMTPAPIVVRETTNLEDAASPNLEFLNWSSNVRLLLATKYRRLPVVDADGKLVGIITRGNVVRAAIQIKRANEGKS